MQPLTRLSHCFTEQVSGALRKPTAAETRRMYKGMNQAAAQHLLSSMYPPPYDGMGLYEQAKPSLMYRVPRVVPDQKARFETDELFRRLSRESEVRDCHAPLYTRRAPEVSLNRRLNHARHARAVRSSGEKPRARVNRLLCCGVNIHTLNRREIFILLNETSNENKSRRSRF